MRYIFLSCLLLGLARWASTQPITVAQADSLRLTLQTNRTDTNRVGALLRLSAYYQGRTLNYAHNLDTALIMANQAYVLSQQLQYVNGQQESIFQRGRIFIKLEQYRNVQRLLRVGNEVTRIRLLLELGKNRLRPTYSQEANLDSAKWYFAQAERLSERIGNRHWQQESQLLTGVAYLFKGDCASGKTWFMRVTGARQRLGDKAGELGAWLRWALTQYGEERCLTNLDSLSRGFTLARQLNNRPTEAILLLMNGYKCLFEGDMSKGKIRQAERSALKAQAIQKSIGYPAINQAYHVLLKENGYLKRHFLGNLLNSNALMADLSSERTPKYVFYVLEVIKDMERNGLQEDLDWPYFWMGNTYFDLGQYDKGLAYFQQSLAVSHQKGEVPVFSGMVRRMAESLIKLGRARQALTLLKDFTSQRLPFDYLDRTIIATGFGQCYTALQQYGRAEHYYQEAIAWSVKTERLEGEYVSWYNLAKFYLATAQYTKAAASLKHVSVHFSESNPSVRKQLHLLQFKVDSAQANLPAALRHYQQYTALKDSLLNETTSKQIAELDIRYQTRQKEQALQLRQKDIALLTQQSYIQQTQRNALLGGTLLLAALLGLGYNRYRLKQRSNQQLQAQQQQINQKNERLSALLTEKDDLLSQQTKLLTDKDQLLNEKELLLKEIHHRVKNNLQVVMSLLNSQAASLQDPLALSAIQESQHRVQTMALIHQELYQSEGIARIPMSDYITDLVTYLHESFDLPQPVQFLVQVAPIELDVTQAVPLGLILNEAVINALKYAFPNGRAGTVEVGLRELGGNSYELMITDDGVGLPADYDPARSRSLGMTLIRGFSEQLSGQLQINNLPGLSICLQFQEEGNTLGH